MDGEFRLDETSLVGKSTFSLIKAANVQGKRISLRFYTSGLDEDFKIISTTFYLRSGGQNNLTEQ